MNHGIYLPFDTETGGVTEGSTLLSVHFAVCDANFNIVDELDLRVKPNGKEAEYNVTAKALEINKIDLIEHDKVAISFSEAGKRVRDFVWANSQQGKVKLIPVGKNIAFDVKKVTDQLLGAPTWNQYVSYRTYDLTTMIIMLKRNGKLPSDAPESLVQLSEYFGIKEDWHTARGDNLAGIKLVKILESL